MKYTLIAAAILVAGALAVVFSQRVPVETVSPEAAARAEWKRTAKEVETAVRPDHFAETKWRSEDEVEMRAPASKSPKKK